MGALTQPGSLGAARHLHRLAADQRRRREVELAPGGFLVDVDWQSFVRQVMVGKSKGVKHVILVSIIEPPVLDCQAARTYGEGGMQVSAATCSRTRPRSDHRACASRGHPLRRGQRLT
jgi:hypothetical protein